MNRKILLLVASVIMSNYAFSGDEKSKDNDLEVSLPGSCCLLYTGIVEEITTYESGKEKPNYGTVIVTDVISVYDGDTFRVNIDSLPPILGKNIAIRVNGIDTPEIRGKCQYEKDLGIKARDFVRGKLFNAKEVKLTNIQRGKYFRIVADVLIDGVSLEELVLDNKLGYFYDGGKKLSWCNK